MIARLAAGRLSSFGCAGPVPVFGPGYEAVVFGGELSCQARGTAGAHCRATRGSARDATRSALGRLGRGEAPLGHACYPKSTTGSTFATWSLMIKQRKPRLQVFTVGLFMAASIGTAVVVAWMGDQRGESSVSNAPDTRSAEDVR